jgi:hypothetical protein
MEGKILAELWNCHYREVSAKEDEIDEIEKAVMLCFERFARRTKWEWIY